MAGTPATEKELLEGCRAGDREAASELLRRHQSALLRYVTYLVGQTALAEEIVQETFVQTLETIDRIDPERGAKRWMVRISSNLARKQMRQNRRSVAVPTMRDDADLHLTAEAINPEARAISSDEIRHCQDAMARLPHRLREVLILHYAEGLKFHEIASILHVSSATVRMRAVRARQRLENLLKQRNRT